MKNFFLACGMVVLMILFFIGITLLLRRWLPLNPSEQGSLMFTNSASMALPMASALLGPENVIFCAPHMGVQNLFIFTLVPYIMNGKAEGGWRKVFLNRNLIAILIGILLFFTRCPVPELLHDVIATVGGTISPISMFMIGILMGGVNFGELFREKKLYLVCLLRLILYPLAIILLIRITGVLEHFPYAGTALMVLIMCISSPVATLITQMSDLYRSHEEAQEASSINVITTLLCSITMPLMVLLYQVICL